jgi:hypothetical protein
MPITKKKRFWSERTLRGHDRVRRIRRSVARRKRKIYRRKYVPKYVLMGYQKCPRCRLVYSSAFRQCPTCMAKKARHAAVLKQRDIKRFEKRYGFGPDEVVIVIHKKHRMPKVPFTRRR